METGRLAAFSLFAGLDDEALDAVATRASEITVDSGHKLAVEGEFGHALYAIESGSAEVTSDGEVLRVLGPGDVFGEVAVLSSGRRTASVVATTPLRLIALFKRDVWALEKEAPAVAQRLRALIAERSTA
jgi:CRP/FNR family cyclic AMP-dependent transcriptional regulator